MVNLNAAQIERLHRLIEECAEVIHAATKTLRHGYESYNPFDDPKETNRQYLERESGNLLVAFELLKESGDQNFDNIVREAKLKAANGLPYLHEEENKNLCLTIVKELSNG